MDYHLVIAVGVLILFAFGIGMAVGAALTVNRPIERKPRTQVRWPGVHPSAKDEHEDFPGC